MTIQFRSTRMDGTRGEWHDVLIPDAATRVHRSAPSQGWAGIEFREVVEDAAQRVTALEDLFSGVFDRGPLPHRSDCPGCAADANEDD